MDHFRFDGKLCVCGMGNRDFAADALGPEVARSLPVNGLSGLGLEGNFREIVSFEPGTEGINNMDTEVLMNGVVKAIGIDCLLLVDSLTTEEPERMFQAIELSTNGGLSPYLPGRIITYAILRVCFPSYSMSECFLLSGLRNGLVPFNPDAWNV